MFINLEKAWAQTVVATVDVRDSPYDLEYNPSNEAIYVANCCPDFSEPHIVSVIDSATNTVTAIVEDVGDGPYNLELQPFK